MLQQGPQKGFGGSPFQHPDAEAACPLLLCKIVHYILAKLKSRGLPSAVIWPAGAGGAALRQSEGTIEPRTDCFQSFATTLCATQVTFNF